MPTPHQHEEDRDGLYAGIVQTLPASHRQGPGPKDGEGRPGLDLGLQTGEPQRLTGDVELHWLQGGPVSPFATANAGKEGVKQKNERSKSETARDSSKSARTGGKHQMRDSVQGDVSGELAARIAAGRGN